MNVDDDIDLEVIQIFMIYFLCLITNLLYYIILKGIATLLRSHIEIRNRTWMKRVHRDCFIGSEAVDFLFSQGFLLFILYIINKLTLN